MRVRVVFLKQCFAWMIHGHLEDPSHEFFIQISHNNHSSSSSSVNYDKNTSSFLSSSPQQQQHDDDKKSNKNNHDDLLLQDIILQKLYQAKINTNHHYRPHSLSSSSSSSSSSSFDWINSYQLRLDYIPSSHISPRIATKIMFSGKAIKLLQQQSISVSTPNNHSSGGSSSTYNENVFGLNNDAYKYLSKSNDKLHIDYQQHKQQQQQQHNKKKTRSKSQNNDGNDDGDNNHDENESDISSGFSNSDIIKYTNRFTEILNATSSSSSSSSLSSSSSAAASSSSSAIELLETVVNDIHDYISNRLWVLLRDKYGFYSFLHVIRNTYLLGN